MVAGLLTLVGLAAITVGAFLLHPAAGFVTAGLALLRVAYISASEDA